MLQPKIENQRDKKSKTDTKEDAYMQKNVWCGGEGYFGPKKIAEKGRKSRQNVNRDKSA